MLTDIQKKQIKLQLSYHKHKDYFVDIKFGDREILKNFLIKENVFRSDIMRGMYLAKYLYFNNGRYKQKKVLDLGCGPGILGLITAKRGAKKVVLTDISDFAVNNTNQNIINFKLKKIATTYQSDLFENIKTKFDIIIFNHPFFPGNPIKNNIISKSMLGGTKLIHQFLEGAKNHLLKGGIIIMPFFSLAGKYNDPKIQGKKHNYIVTEKFNLKLNSILHKGKYFIYELKL